MKKSPSTVVVGYEYDPISVCADLSDAEELLLAIAEENVYTDWLWTGRVHTLSQAAQGYWITEGVPVY